MQLSVCLTVGYFQVVKKRDDARVVCEKKKLKRTTRSSSAEDVSVMDDSASVDWKKGDSDGIYRGPCT
jgi:hypothetical protein